MLRIRTRIVRAVIGATRTGQTPAAIGRIPPDGAAMTVAATVAVTILAARVVAVSVAAHPARAEAAVVHPVDEGAATN